MDKNELIQRVYDISKFLEIDRDRLVISEYDNRLFIDDMTAIAIHGIENSFLYNCDLEIIDEENKLLAILCFSKTIHIHVASFTKEAYIAYLIESSTEQFDNQVDYDFKFNYVVISRSNLDRYLQSYANSSSIWGGFTHSPPSTPLIMGQRVIQAKPNIRIPTTVNANHLIKATCANNCFYRYLSLYHQLELLFDFIFVKKIKKLNPDLDGVGSVVKDYVNLKTELDSIKAILREFFNDFPGLERFIENIDANTYGSLMKNVFQDHSKGGNIFVGDKEDKWAVFLELISNRTFSKEKLVEHRIINNEKVYEKFLLDITSYWVYRIRCCIAHQKIGEYIFKDSDENFVNDLGVGLLKFFIGNIFSSQDLVTLIDHN